MPPPWKVDWTKQSGPTATPVGPRNPEAPYKGPQAGATLGKTQADTTRTKVQTQGDVLSNQNAQRALVQNPISETDQKFINTLREGALAASSQLKDISGAQAAVDRFQPSPGRGALYSWGVPESDDWAPTVGIKSLIGAFLPQQSKEDYQTLRGLQARSVLSESATQKGPQTEFDASRMAMAGVSPDKDVRPNAQALADSQYDAMMKQQQPEFFTYWANKLGSVNALNGQGKTAAQVWAEQYDRGLKKMRGGAGYQGKTGIIGNSQSPAKANSDIDAILRKHGVK